MEAFTVDTRKLAFILSPGRLLPKGSVEFERKACVGMHRLRIWVNDPTRYLHRTARPEEAPSIAVPRRNPSEQFAEHALGIL